MMTSILVILRLIVWIRLVVLQSLVHALQVTLEMDVLVLVHIYHLLLDEANAYVLFIMC